jgi:serine/threonine protein kinase
VLWYCVQSKTQVWIEWKEYDLNHQLPTWNQTIEDRVKKLAALLGLQNKTEEFRAPYCLGFFDDRDEDTSRYGLIYSRPDGVSPAAEPISPLDLIRKGEKPSLTKRIGLTHAIAQSLMYLHSVNWLHKAFRSDNIVFFNPPGQEPDYATPTVSGFEYARPDLLKEITEKPSENFEHDIYRHPEAIMGSGVRSKKSYDIYSLGVILVEIACWQTIEDIVDNDRNQKHARTELRKTRKLLLGDQLLRKVTVTADERYRDVVRRCLTGGAELRLHEGADESDSDVEADMQQAFSKEVLGKLGNIQL